MSSLENMPELVREFELHEQVRLLIEKEIRAVNIISLSQLLYNRLPYDQKKEFKALINLYSETLLGKRFKVIGEGFQLIDIGGDGEPDDKKNSPAGHYIAHWYKQQGKEVDVTQLDDIGEMEELKEIIAVETSQIADNSKEVPKAIDPLTALQERYVSDSEADPKKDDIHKKYVPLFRIALLQTVVNTLQKSDNV